MYGVRRVVVGGCQSLGQGLFLEDTRDYEIRTRDEGLKERHISLVYVSRKEGNSSKVGLEEDM